MAITAVPGPDDKKVEASEVQSLATKGGFTLSASAVSDFQVLLGSLDDTIQQVLSEEDYLPRPDLSKYPRTDISVCTAEESDKGAWASRCVIKATQPTRSLLAGKTVAIKDNTAVAGVACFNGIKAGVDGPWVPDFDASVVTRVLDAGGVITGKAVCENACMEPSSDTAASGQVHNPYADGYSCGGSSSGSGRLVAVGAVHMALGCDQGGSVRIPASFCGLVGLKPTWGLVPYTGILSLHPEIDHCGPMTRTVRDCAVLLEAIAGPDGIDDRQPLTMPDSTLRFSSNLAHHFAHQPAATPLAGLRVGVLKEGFEIDRLDANVAAACKAAIADLASLGAEVKDVSVPAHAGPVLSAWSTVLPLSGGREAFFGCGTGRKGLHVTDKYTGPHPAISQADFDAYGAGAQNLIMRYLYVEEKYGAKVHARAANQVRKARDAYDTVLREVDVLVMPTLPFPATKNLTEGGVLERLTYMAGTVANTAPFDSTGHPALSVPVGWVPSPQDGSVKLPTGLQVVGRQFEDEVCLRVGMAWEGLREWKELEFGMEGMENGTK